MKIRIIRATAAPAMTPSPRGTTVSGKHDHLKTYNMFKFSRACSIQVYHVYMGTPLF